MRGRQQLVKPMTVDSSEL